MELTLVKAGNVLLLVTAFFSAHAVSYSNTLLNRVGLLGKSLIMSVVKTNAAWLVLL